MKNKRVLISGASIAGPALAYWLHRYGFDVTVVEKAPEVRRGGQAVDFKGPIHMTVLRRMGILDAVRAANVPSDDGILVNAKGRTIGTIPGAFAGGEINVPRGDLAHILHDLTAGRCEYVFGDSISSITETADGVDVTFVNGRPRTFDLVVGADGMHSTTRALAFGPESDYVTHLGHYYVLATIDAGHDDVMYNEPGRMAAIGGSKAPAFFVFAADPLPPARDDVDRQKQQVVDAYRDGRWRLPELMAKIPASTDFYMDSISRATLDHYSRGRVVLVGDAAYGNALGGYGTGLAMVGAHVLAGELAVADGDHHRAFQQYENRFRPYASISQKVNAGRLLAPRTRLGIVARNAMFTAMSVVGPLVKVFDRPATNIDLPDYDARTTDGAPGERPEHRRAA
jgi:2-polyprenyl-6-methoxyphenol hydroxylase-like FAD-dependent oxidoreductase